MRIISAMKEHKGSLRGDLIENNKKKIQVVNWISNVSFSGDQIALRREIDIDKTIYRKMQFLNILPSRKYVKIVNTGEEIS